MVEGNRQVEAEWEGEVEEEGREVQRGSRGWRRREGRRGKSVNKELQEGEIGKRETTAYLRLHV